MRALKIAALLTAVVMAGCAAPSKYSWGDYERSLYSYYKDPAKEAEFATALEKTIQMAEQTQKPVPPGLYAEYGFLLLQQGKGKDAIPYFEKEKSKWPESAFLMNSMIQTASKTTTKSTEVK